MKRGGKKTSWVRMALIGLIILASLTYKAPGVWLAWFVTHKIIWTILVTAGEIILAIVFYNRAVKFLGKFSHFIRIQSFFRRRMFGIIKSVWRFKILIKRKFV
ncbi:MAG: hypothetical protein PHN74_02110 [Candidatus Pacebacteria bacterium]|nr:hypothetical protein [Candidatus Paceibacterota bacterium]